MLHQCKGAGISTAAGVLDYATAEGSDVAVRTPGTVGAPNPEGHVDEHCVEICEQLEGSEWSVTSDS